jgi:probable selenium-dependent hydroxylase accessory protein YqeC
MELADVVLSVCSPAPRRGSVLAFVGAGGKTTGIYALAGELAARGARVLVTTTTMMYDPAAEGGRGLDGVELLPDPTAGALARIRDRAAAGRVLLVASSAVPAEGKLRGIDPGLLESMAPAFDCLLVEADGSRRLPVKAPGPAEPVMPPGADLVLGLVGLDCLGRPIASDTVHRHELFARLVGALPGEPVTPTHLAALAAAQDGLFKAAPAAARRVVVLNKAELLPAGALERVMDAIGTGFDLVAGCSLAARSDRVLALRSPGGRYP